MFYNWEIQIVYDLQDKIQEKKAYFYPSSKYEAFLAEFCGQQDQRLFLKSRNTAPVNSTLFMAESHLSIRVAKDVWQEWCFRKPDWNSWKSVFVSI